MAVAQSQEEERILGVITGGKGKQNLHSLNFLVKKKQLRFRYKRKLQKNNQQKLHLKKMVVQQLILNQVQLTFLAQKIILITQQIFYQKMFQNQLEMNKLVITKIINLLEKNGRKLIEMVQIFQDLNTNKEQNHFKELVVQLTQYQQKQLRSSKHKRTKNYYQQMDRLELKLLVFKLRQTIYKHKE